MVAIDKIKLTVQKNYKKIIVSSNGNSYQIIRYIGMGKNSIVFFVLCLSGAEQGCFFALKTQYNSDERRIQRFYREVAFLKQQKHLLIVRYVDDGHYRYSDNERYPFVIISFLPNTLQDYIGKMIISLEKKVRFTCQLLSLLQWLKKNNIVHRDIKPQNILTDSENIVLGDWGLLKHLNKEAVLFENLIDNSDFFEATDLLLPQSYRTPELVAYANRSDIMRIESDVFQLGLVLTEMFTSTNPLIPNDNGLEKLQLKSFPRIAGEYGNRIHDLLSGMLEIDYKKRLTVEFLLERFINLYQNIIS